jgi:hypothetical protein
VKKLFVGGIVALVGVVGVSKAFAAGGCSAVNAGAWNVSLKGPIGNLPTLTFNAADKITFVLGVVGSGQASPIPVNVIEPIGFPNGDVRTPGPATFSYTVAAAHASLTDTLDFSTFNGGTVTLTATCSRGQANNGRATNSQNARALQLGVTKTVGTNSGIAMAGAIDVAISNAFSSTAEAPITVAPNGFTMNFAEEAPSNVVRHTDEAFSALGDAGNGHINAPPVVRNLDWNAWADVRGTGFDQNDALSDTHGTQINFTGGVGRKIMPALLVGMYAGYEHFNFTVESLAGQTLGNGGTFGAYAAYRLDPHWRADGMIGASDVWYTAAAGTAAGSFTGSRLLGSGGLTGDYRYSAFLLEPSTRIFTLREADNAWTDSLGTTQASRNFSESRVSTGGKVTYPWQAAGMQISPYVGSYGDYRFSTDNALPVGVPFVGIKDGWSARATTGVTFGISGGASLSIGGELGGIGAGYDIWSANARMIVPF